MRKKFLSMSLALGLVASLFVGVIGASADDHSEVVFGSAYFPFVPNGEVVDGTGPWYGTVSIQNMEDDNTIRVFALDKEYFSGDQDDALWNTTIQPKASKTFTADSILSGSGSSLVLLAVYEDFFVNGDDDDDYEAPNFGAVLKQSAAEPMSSNARTSAAHVSVDGHTAIPGNDIAWGRNSEFCYEIWYGGDVDGCQGVGSYFFGLPSSGFGGSSYLPIVQTNSGWNTVIAMSNVDASIQNAGVNLTLIPSEGSTFGSGQIQHTVTLNPGETEFLNLADFLADQGIADDWVGSAWIESDVGIASSALRLKAETNMLAINTAAPSLFSGFGDLGDLSGFDFDLYGPLVYKEYNGWNTGISMVNLSEVTNTVGVTFYGPTGNAMQSEQITLPPRGSNFIYAPAAADANLNPGFVGSVAISPQAPVHATVDQVKYATGEAMSYSATRVGIDASYWWDNWSGNKAIGMPLVQKGNVNGMGDVSGVQLLNADFDGVGRANVSFYLSGGSLAAPTQNAPIAVNLSPMSSITLYTMNYSQMPSNFLGSVEVRRAYGQNDGNIVGVSNNVNYAVSGDGSTAFNMISSWGQFRVNATDGTVGFDD